MIIRKLLPMGFAFRLLFNIKFMATGSGVEALGWGHMATYGKYFD